MNPGNAAMHLSSSVIRRHTTTKTPCRTTNTRIYSNMSAWSASAAASFPRAYISLESKYRLTYLTAWHVDKLDSFDMLQTQSRKSSIITLTAFYI